MPIPLITAKLLVRFTIKKRALDGPGHELYKYIAIFVKVTDNDTVQVRGQMVTV